jgi:hypothetical protein
MRSMKTLARALASRCLDGGRHGAGLAVQQHRDVAVPAPQRGLVDHQDPAAFGSSLGANRVRSAADHTHDGIPAQTVPAGQLADREPDVRGEGAGHPAGGLAGQLRVLRREPPIALPALVAAHHRHQRGGRPNEGQIAPGPGRVSRTLAVGTPQVGRRFTDRRRPPPPPVRLVSVANAPHGHHPERVDDTSLSLLH